MHAKERQEDTLKYNRIHIKKYRDKEKVKEVMFKAEVNSFLMQKGKK